MAERADRYELYEAAVQDPQGEVNFIQDTYRALRDRPAKILREDFSGTGSMACRWVVQGPAYRATAVDIDRAVLDWGRANRLSRLTPAQQRRVRYVAANVLTVRAGRPDVIAALNFSYWVFKQRKTLRRYFRSAHRALRPGGMLFLDAFGGYEAFKVLKERRRERRFTYVWDQAVYRPVTGEILCYIHFRFPDGSRLDRAFTYDWRLWTLPEIREVLNDAGFRRVTVYWEGDDGKGGGNGEFKPELHGEAEAGWIAYVVAEK
jgi:SAM-dependent methyltransferase